jgi:hypothetical protein
VECRPGRDGDAEFSGFGLDDQQLPENLAIEVTSDLTGGHLEIPFIVVCDRIPPPPSDSLSRDG